MKTVITHDMKTIIIDIGNTFVKTTLFCNGTIAGSAHFRHDDIAGISDYLGKAEANGGAYAAVGRISQEMQDVFSAASFPLKEISVADIPESLATIRYQTPQTLGIDRIAAIIGAQAISGDSDILVVDVGTCITYDLLVTTEEDGSAVREYRGGSAAKEYLGGNISPGIDMRLKAMNAFTEKLPMVNAEGETPDIGFSTETAIRSGVINGISHEIEGFISQFSAKFPRVKVYLTGGGAKLLHISHKIHTFADDFLVERGIYTIYKSKFPA